jgi:predicted DNA-binding transcriptional regulator AlpA
VSTARDDYVFPKELQQLFVVSPQTVKRWIKNNLLPTPIKLGSRVMWPREQIEAILQTGRPRQQHDAPAGENTRPTTDDAGGAARA